MKPGRRLLGFFLIGSLSLAGGAAYYHFRPAPQPALASSPRLTRLAPPLPGASPPPGRAKASVAASAAPAAPPPGFTEQRRPAPRHYVGTVGGQPATAEFSWSHPDSVSGRFYYWRGSTEYQITSPAGRGTQELVVAVEWPDSTQANGQWRLSRPPGPLLQGTWVAANGQRQPFVLREDYQGSARYELLASTLTMPIGERYQAPVYRHDFVHLLGPAARRLPLRRAQCPPKAGRQRFVRDFPHDGDVFCDYSIDVTLNEFQLLGYRTWGLVDPFEGQNDWEITYTLLDLTTGRELTLDSQLRPGYARPLRRLLGARVIASNALREGRNLGFTPKWVQEHGRRVLLAPLPGQDPEDMAYGAGMGLTAQGLAVEYAYGTDVLLLPYRELRPLVRPGTPLARLLKARGLW